MFNFLTRVAIVLIATLPINAQAQFVNNDWKWGRHFNEPGTFPWGGTKIMFYNDSISIQEEQNRSMFIEGTYSGLGTSDGQYFIYTNGYTICNKNHDTITNGAGLTPGGNDSIYESWGIPVPFNAVFLPYPGSDRLMVMISADNYFENGYYCAKNIFYSLIDPSGNNGQGIVLVKNQILLTDTLTNAGFAVTRHANGRDWWVLIKRYSLNDFAKFLITADGPLFAGFESTPGINAEQGYGIFSPNGNKLAYFSNSFQLRIYDFDRCSGLINNMLYKVITHETAGSVAFSPNSRYLYITKWDSLWQFDMEAPDVLNSQLLIASYSQVPDPVTGWVTGFANLYPAADGKIYLQNFSGVMLNVINNPDMPGQACNFVQHQIQCPTYYYATVPTYVNLNLMQEHGSICDTLGVGNEELIIKKEGLNLYPNPANDKVLFTFKGNASTAALAIYDMSGAIIYSTSLAADANQLFLDVSNFAKGVYVAHFINNETSSRIKFMVHK